MGLLISSLFSRLFGKQEVRVLILGLDNAGLVIITIIITSNINQLTIYNLYIY